jgi:hypothetical protein
MRHPLTTPCLLLLLAGAAGCEIGDQADDAELGPDGGIDDTGEDEVHVGTSSSAVTTTKLHLYGDRSYQGVEVTRSSYDANFANDGFNDIASSLINPTGDFWLLYEHRDYGGRKICMRPQSLLPVLGYVAYGSTGTWNDRISSVKRRGPYRASCGDGVPVVGSHFAPSP